MIAYFVIAQALHVRMFPADVEKIDGAETFIQNKLKELGSWTRAQKNTVFCFAVANAVLILLILSHLFMAAARRFLKMYNRLFLRPLRP